MPLAVRAQRAFTLIEIMVVIVIIAVIVTVATLSTDRIGDRDQTAEARDRLQALIRLSADRAMIEGGEFGLELSRDGYRFLRYREEQWRVPDAEEFRQREWPESVRASLQLEGQSVDLQSQPGQDASPHVLMTSTAEMTPFRLTLRHRDESYGLVLEADENGQMIRWHERDGRPSDENRGSR